MILKTRLGDGEIDDGDLDAHFRQIVGVRHLRRHVEPEVAVVVDVAVAQSDQQTSALVVGTGGLALCVITGLGRQYRLCVTTDVWRDSAGVIPLSPLYCSPPVREVWA